MINLKTTHHMNRDYQHEILALRNAILDCSEELTEVRRAITKLDKITERLTREQKEKDAEPSDGGTYDFLGEIVDFKSGMDPEGWKEES